MKQLWGIAATLLVVGLGPLVAEEAAPKGVSAADAAVTLSAEIKIGTGLENREVVGAADTFAAGTPQLVGWTRITGATKPTQIIHVWKLNGKEISSVPLSATSSPFRTNSRKTVVGPGTYTLEVRDMNGNVINSKDVTVADK
jgi:hypothetical protein